MKLNPISAIRSKISLKFATTVILTIIIVLLISSYFEIKTYMKDSNTDLDLKIDTISAIAVKAFSNALWNYNDAAIRSAAEGLLQDIEIAGVEVTNGHAQIVCSYVNLGDEYSEKYLINKVVPIQYKDEIIGEANISFTRYFIQTQIKKTIVLRLTQIGGLSLFLIIIINFISYRITKPLQELSNGVDQLSYGNLKERVSITSNDEVGKLASRFNNMAAELEKAYQDLEMAYRDLENDALELEEKNDEIQHYSENLETLVADRTADYNKANYELLERNKELNDTINALNVAQNQLIQTEKLAALGSIVAGVAHEINTPLGVGITGISFLEDLNSELRQKLSEGSLTKDDLKKFVESVNESIEMTSLNLYRAAELIKSFKKLAVDQSNDIKTEFNFKESINTVLISLKHEYKRPNHKIINRCPDDIFINSYPGDFMQIFTNLIINSINHGFINKENGNIDISVALEDNSLKIIYTDDGVGITKENLNKIYDPFFTTNRQGGGSGLGLNIVYNLITQKLKGRITCESNPGEGVKFIIDIPCDLA